MDYPKDQENAREITIHKPFLKLREFHLQPIQSISLTKLMRILGYLAEEEWGGDRSATLDMPRFGL
jgi:hypothetical protein